MQGTLFHDRNGNGTQDAGEPGIAGAEVTLSDARRDVELTRTATTDADGLYTFEEVPEGLYTLSVVLPPGQQAANLPALTVTVSGGAVTVPPTPIELRMLLHLPLLYKTSRSRDSERAPEPAQPLRLFTPLVGR